MAESLSAPQTSAESSKRTSLESSGRPSVEDLKRASVESGKRLSITKQEMVTSEHTADKSEGKGELPGSYIQSKFNRKGSVQYRNAGWRSSQKKVERNDSSSSIKSNVSENALMEKNKAEFHEISQMSSVQRQVYVQQKFADITNILKDAGIDEDILENLKN